MNTIPEEKLPNQTPKWLANLLPLISTILGSGCALVCLV